MNSVSQSFSKAPSFLPLHILEAAQPVKKIYTMEDRQRSATHGNLHNYLQTGVCMKQMEIPILQELKQAEVAPWDLVERCRDEHDALMLCIQLSRTRYTAKQFAEHLDIDPGHWSRIRSGDAHFPTNKRLQLMQLCGNLAPMQFELSRAGLRGVFEVWDAARRAA